MGRGIKKNGQVLRTLGGTLTVFWCIAVITGSAVGATLVHRWSFDGNTSDSSGSGLWRLNSAQRMAMPSQFGNPRNRR